MSELSVRTSRGIDETKGNPLTKELKPLREMNFKLIQEPLTGLLRNMDSDLQRLIREVQATRDFERFRQLTLLLVMLRIAVNSYQATAFLLTDLEEHPKRLPRFVIVVPPINRQIMDLWFSLVYMMDDFAARSLDYEQYAYRQLREHIDSTRNRYGADPERQDWFSDMEELSRMMESQLPLTAEQKTDPKKTIPSWPHPHALTERSTKSQDFLIFLHELIYGDTSIESHLKPSGLLTVAGIVLADAELFPEHIREKIEGRTIHQYKFHHYCRTVLTVLGIVSEIEIHCNLNNKEQTVKIWERLADYHADTKEIYASRYKASLG